MVGRVRAVLDCAEAYRGCRADAHFIEAPRAVAHGLQGHCASLKAHGSTLQWRERMPCFDGSNALTGIPEPLADGRRYDGRP